MLGFLLKCRFFTILFLRKSSVVSIKLAPKVPFFLFFDIRVPIIKVVFFLIFECIMVVFVILKPSLLLSKQLQELFWKRITDLSLCSFPGPILMSRKYDLQELCI